MQGLFTHYRMETCEGFLKVFLKVLVSNVTGNGLVLKHQAISIHSAVSIVLCYTLNSLRPSDAYMRR